MSKTWRWFLAAIVALIVTFSGLLWDVAIHSREHGHVVEESLFNLSNPGHVVFGLGLVLTALVTLMGFTVSWLGERRPEATWQMVSVPAGLWLGVGLVGLITFAALMQAS